jgi:hypothetical protein
MKNEQNYRIYAIIAEDKVCVGKTTAKRIEPILWRHQRGDISCTRDHFRRGLCEPRIVVLEAIRADVHMAYRHTIAFIRIFADNGYRVLNTPGMIEDAMDIHPMTQAILDDLTRTPLSEWLSQESHSQAAPTPVTAPPSRTPAPPKGERVTDKLSIHVTPAEREQFEELTHGTGVTQRQSLMLMIQNAASDDPLNADWSANEYVRLMLGGYKEEISKLEAQIQELEDKLRTQDTNAGKTREKRDIARQQAICDYYAYYNSACSGNDPLPQGRYRDYFSGVDPALRPKYPTTEDTFLFFPQAILMGKGRTPALFIVGLDDCRQKILLRFYAKQYWLGLRFTHSTFGRAGSRWLVKCERARDGAMNVVVALPLDIVPQNDCDRSSTGGATGTPPPDGVDALIRWAQAQPKDQE